MPQLSSIMPVLNGIEFLEAHQQLPPAQRQARVIVMLTTALLPHDLERVRQLPIAGVISKPLTPDKLHLLLPQQFPA